jgi:chaperonin cofactor prefoldin
MISEDVKRSIERESENRRKLQDAILKLRQVEPYLDEIERAKKNLSKYEQNQTLKG